MIPYGRADADGTIPGRFRAVAAQAPDALALADGATAYTYRGLDAASDRVAAGLAGLSRQRPVGLVFPHGAEALVALLGAFKAGLPAMPVDPAALPEGGAALLATAQLLVAPPGVAAWCREQVPGVPVTAGLPDADPVPPPPIGPEDPAIIFLTSASTGPAKGVVHSHRTACRSAWRAVRLDATVPGDRIAHLAAFAHAASLTNVLVAWCSGVALDSFDLRGPGAAAFPAWAAARGITVLGSVAPSVLRRLMDMFAAAGGGWQPRLLRCGGEGLTVADARRMREALGWRCDMVHILVSTDAGYIAAWKSGDGPLPADGPLPVGLPAEGRAVWTADEAGVPLPPGEPGEIVVSGDDLPLGYWERPDLTEATFRADPDRPGHRMVFTGDLGRFGPDGTLEHLGRKDHLVKVRGHRVPLAVVEAALRRLPGVAEAVVVPNAAADGGTRLLAYAEAAPGAAPGPMALRRGLLANLPEFMVPWRILVVDALPRTAFGKVARRALPPLTRARPDELPAAVPPSTATEAALAAAWADLFEIEPIGRDDDFFELGADSLDLATLAARFAGEDATAFFDAVMRRAPTLAAMAAVLDAQAAAWAGTAAEEDPSVALWGSEGEEGGPVA